MMRTNNHRKFLLLFLLICSALICSGCTFNVETVEGLPDYEGAKNFSEQMVSLVIAEKNDQIYSKMNDYFQKNFPPSIIPETNEKMIDHFGKLIEVDYKTNETGNWQYNDGSKTLVRKFWYRAKTTKEEMGKYFLQVSVVNNGSRMACLSFSLLEFPDGIPEKLK